jgi:hypothetical protein
VKPRGKPRRAGDAAAAVRALEDARRELVHALDRYAAAVVAVYHAGLVPSMGGLL